MTHCHQSSYTLTTRWQVCGGHTTTLAVLASLPHKPNIKSRPQCDTLKAATSSRPRPNQLPHTSVTAQAYMLAKLTPLAIPRPAFIPPSATSHHQLDSQLAQPALHLKLCRQVSCSKA
jgi:hypothetical protein